MPWTSRPGTSGATSCAPPLRRRYGLARIWSELLGRDEFSIHDSFFEIGGHSLLAGQMLARIREAFKLDLPWSRLFEAPTIAALAATIDTGASSGAGAAGYPLAYVPRDGTLRPSVGQQRLWFLDQLVPGTASYNVLRALRFRGALDIDALERSLNEIIRRHEILRATFPAVNGEPILAIAPVLALQLTEGSTTERGAGICYRRKTGTSPSTSPMAR